MPIRVECGSCGKKLNVKDASAGRRIKCPDCGDPIQVPGGKRRKKGARRRPAPEEEDGETDYSSLDFGQLARLERRSESLGQGTVEECPACGEPVGAKALECPHCFEPIQEIKQMERTRKRLTKDAQKPVILQERELTDRQLRAASRRGAGGGANEGITAAAGIIGVSMVIGAVIAFTTSGPEGVEVTTGVRIGLVFFGGWITSVIAGLWLLGKAFGESAMWGLACLFIPFAGLVFVIKHWDVAGLPFIVNLVGGFIAGIGIAVAGTSAVPF